ncbi:MAG: 2-isopropylmalate synthase, partial [Endomicrobium sp.]|jgi:2-isopropylmalate synthase|nr:2-isopropylmalate synthase [Endomicrobium sp.]
VYKAIDKIVKMDITLTEFSLRAVSSGEDALGEVSLKVKYKENIYCGKGTSIDIIEAGAKAYMQALNKAKSFEIRKGK